MSGADPNDVRLDADQAKSYVCEQVQRWAEARPGHTCPQRTIYAWTTPRPGPRLWHQSAFENGDYLEVRKSMVDPDEDWISELRPARTHIPAIQDVAPIQVSPNLLSPQECVALLQTTFYEAGFGFHNLVPEWPRMHVSKVAVKLVLSAAAEGQQLC